MHRLTIDELGALSLSYPEVGATAGDVLPAGYRHVRRRLALGRGPLVFAHVARSLKSWEMHRRAGIRVIAHGAVATPGQDVLLGVSIVQAPCRIVYVLDDGQASGFAYGTLTGHPESGEESFVVRMDPDGRVEFEITAFSRPGTTLSRLGGPIARMVQDRLTDRYAAAMTALAKEARTSE